MKAVVFDMDGLMFDSERVVQYSWKKAGMLLIHRDLGQEIYHTLGFSKKRRREYFQELLGESFDFETFQILSSYFYYQYIKENGIPVKKGLIELLDYLQGHQFFIALATSSSYKNTIKHLENVQIKDYFDVIITGDQVVKAKPDPEIYMKACQKLNIEAENAYALEDSYHGIISAYQAGMKPIFVPDLLNDEAPIQQYIETKCDSLLEVINYLEGG